MMLLSTISKQIHRCNALEHLESSGTFFYWICCIQIMWEKNRSIKTNTSLEDEFQGGGGAGGLSTLSMLT